MTTSVEFNPTFDFLREAEGGDPDKYSPTLKAYHQRLWSKPLPDGRPWELQTAPGGYLHHASDLGEFWLSSDAAIPTWKFWTRPAIADVVRQVTEPERDEFYRISYQMGGMMIFPGNRIEGQHTINQARGTRWQIADRLDLTLECIRLHYLGEPSPLADVLARYDDFFALFGDFTGYCRHFLLQDLLSADGSRVDVFPPFRGFDVSPLPTTVDEYLAYRDSAVRFVASRNQRMVAAVTR